MVTDRRAWCWDCRYATPCGKCITPEQAAGLLTADRLDDQPPTCKCATTCPCYWGVQCDGPCVLCAPTRILRAVQSLTVTDKADNP